MYTVGDYVMKVNCGVCHVEDIIEMEAPNSKLKKKYFLLVPEDTKKSKIFIPVENSPTDVRPVLSEAEAWNIIEAIPSTEIFSVVDERKRELEYKQVINTGDPKKLVSILKMLHLRKKKREEEGKRVTATDERYCKMAENTLFSELAFSIGRDKAEVCKLIEEKAHA